jgi:uncharacterized membrane protein YphA (DoxX/SURF4 family)
MLAMIADKYKECAPSVLRIGIALVVLWFGINQLINPQSFLGYVPQWFSSHSAQLVHEHPLQLLHSLPLTPHILIMGNGILEVIFGIFLLLGLFTRISSLIVSLHLFIIALGLGYNDIMIRDLGLAIAAFSIFLYGNDAWCLNDKIRFLSAKGWAKNVN